jgi:hypothetical protein
MDNSAWLGLVLGMAIGGAYAWLHLWSLKRSLVRQQQGQPPKPVQQMLAGVARVVGFFVAAFLVLQYTNANKWWLMGSIAVAYSVPFFWKLKDMVSQKK